MHKEKMEEWNKRAHACYSAPGGDRFFPGGEAQMRDVLYGFWELTGGRYTDGQAIKIFEQFVLIAVIFNNDESSIPEKITAAKDCGRLPDVPDLPEMDTLYALAAFFFLLMNQRAYTGELALDHRAVNQFADMFRMSAKNRELNAGGEVSAVSPEKYGMDANNPVFTAGIRGSHAYLERLRHGGEPVTYKRIGSAESDTSAGMVDMYRVAAKSGELLAILYLNMYGGKNSNTPPQGFTLAKTESPIERRRGH